MGNPIIREVEYALSIVIKNPYAEAYSDVFNLRHKLGSPALPFQPINHNDDAWILLVKRESGLNRDMDAQFQDLLVYMQENLTTTDKRPHSVFAACWEGNPSADELYNAARALVLGHDMGGFVDIFAV